MSYRKEYKEKDEANRKNRDEIRDKGKNRSKKNNKVEYGHISNGKSDGRSCYRKNDIFSIRIEDMSDNGEGIGKTDGFTWFVKDSIIGDLVEVKAMKIKKSYGFARLINVLEASSYRITPRCPVSRQCGGCQFQDMDYEEQLRFKENMVCNNLRRIGGVRYLLLVDEKGRVRYEEKAEAKTGVKIQRKTETEREDMADVALKQDAVLVYPIIGMENPWRYRNKAQFPVGRNKDGKIIMGFYANHSHTIIEHDDCLLGVSENKVILACIRDFMEDYGIDPYDEQTHTGVVRHVLIRKAFKTGQIMVCLVINGQVETLKAANELVRRLLKIDWGKSEARREENETGSDSQIVTISCSVNCKRTNVIMGEEIVCLYGPGTITDFIGDIGYRISPLSFYQVNSLQTERLYHTVLALADLTGTEIIWDLYCGIGTISLALAKRAAMVYGVEVVPEAIEDARENAAYNGITNVEFFVGKAEKVLSEQYEKMHVCADVIVVDPPRKGCDELCLSTMVKMSAKRIVYVSCDSATLARDLKYLCGNEYRVEKVRMVDMFGWGRHVETVCLLSRKAQ